MDHLHVLREFFYRDHLAPCVRLVKLFYSDT